MTQTRGTADKSNDGLKANDRRDDRLQAESVAADNPALSLQRTVGNRAVQRLVAQNAGVSPAHIQRHISPGTSALGSMLHASLLSNFADVSTDVATLQNTTSSLSQTANTLLTDSTQFLIFQVAAENYPAAGNEGVSQPIAPGGQTTTD